MKNPNAVYCLNCRTIILSAYHHDFQRCACEDDDDAVWVDGGQDYKRRAMGVRAHFIEANGEVYELNGETETNRGAT